MDRRVDDARDRSGQRNDDVSSSVAEFAETYAEVNAADHGLPAAAAATGRVPVAAG